MAESSGVAALLLRLERAREVEDIIPLLDALILELHSPRHQRLQRAFIAWIGRVIFKRAGITETIPEFNGLQEVRSMLADRALEWKDEYIHRGMLIGKKEGISIGRNEGISLGETKGVKSVLQALLQSRFGVLPQDVAAPSPVLPMSGACKG